MTDKQLTHDNEADWLGEVHHDLVEQNELLEQIADSLEDIVKQQALIHNLNLYTDDETGRRRQR